MIALWIYIHIHTVCIWGQCHWLGIVNWRNGFPESCPALMLVKVFKCMCFCKKYYTGVDPKQIFVDQSNFMVFQVWARKGWRWWSVCGWWWWWYRRQCKTTHGVGRREEETKSWAPRIDRASRSKDKPEIMRAENPECKGRQQWDKRRSHADQTTQSIQNVLGDKWETTGRQVRNHADQLFQITQCALGDKPEITRADDAECSGR